jgi:hypothetical protein
MTTVGHPALPAPANDRGAWTSPLAIWLARGSIAGALIFAATWAILGLFRPGYSFVSQPITGLGLGPGAVMMNGAFILTGLLFVAGPIGSFMLTRDLGLLARWSSAILLALSGVGAILCGLFTWESFAPHMLGSALGLAGPILGFFVAGLALRRSPHWRRLGSGLLVGAALTLMLVVAFFATFSVEAVLAGRGVAGLIERLLTLEIHAWYIALALATTRQDAPGKAYKGPPMEGSLLPLGAIVGPILFDVAWIVMGHLRPGYSPVGRPISALAVGPDGVFVRAAFLLYGALVTVGTVSALRSVKRELGAVAHWACTLLLILSPLGILWAGVFTMDAMGLHIAGAQVGCGTPIIVLPVAGLLLRRAPSWRRFGTWMLLGGPLTIALTAGFMQSVPLSEMATGGGTFGLWQRALFLEIQAWYVAIAWVALREQERRRPFTGPPMEGFIASWYTKNTRSEARAQGECARSIGDRVPAGGRVLEVAPGPGWPAEPPDGPSALRKEPPDLLGACDRVLVAEVEKTRHVGAVEGEVAKQIPSRLLRCAEAAKQMTYGRRDAIEHLEHEGGRVDGWPQQQYGDWTERGKLSLE